MSWYKTGSVSVVQNSNAVIGTGTAFIANGRVGDAFQGPDGDWYEVTNIASDTAMSIAPNYKSATNTVGAYVLAPMQGYNKDTADALRAASLQVGDALDGLEESVLEAANSAASALASKNSAEISEANAGSSASAALASKNAAALSETHSADSASAALASKNSAAISGTNAATSAGEALASKVAAAISEANAAASAGSAASLGVGRGYIDGLRLSYVSPNSISVSSGAAYIQSSAKNLLSPSAIIVSGLVLTASTMYHVYLYDNAGTPAIEVVTAAPVIYSGRARNKTGDSSRRYLGSVLAGAANTIFKFLHLEGRIIYGTNTEVAPFVLVTSAVIVAQTVDCKSVIPVSGTRLTAVFINRATDTAARLGNPDLINPVSSLQYEVLVTGATATVVQAGLSLSSVQTFQWRHDGPANGTFTAMCAGYEFER